MWNMFRNYAQLYLLYIVAVMCQRERPLSVLRIYDVVSDPYIYYTRRILAIGWLYSTGIIAGEMITGACGPTQLSTGAAYYDHIVVVCAPRLLIVSGSDTHHIARHSHTHNHKALSHLCLVGVGVSLSPSERAVAAVERWPFTCTTRSTRWVHVQMHIHMHKHKNTQTETQAQAHRHAVCLGQ